MKNLKNNKGFSLVELIIVIAIMAVLIGILAPQYLKYVEKSRVTADDNLIEDLATAAEVAASDPDGVVNKNFTITVNNTNTTLSVESDDGTVKKAIESVLPSDYADGKLGSKKYSSGSATIKVEFGSDSIPKITVTKPGSAGATPTP